MYIRIASMEEKKGTLPKSTKSKTAKSKTKQLRNTIARNVSIANGISIQMSLKCTCSL